MWGWQRELLSLFPSSAVRSQLTYAATSSADSVGSFAMVAATVSPFFNCRLRARRASADVTADATASNERQLGRHLA